MATNLITEAEKEMEGEGEPTRLALSANAWGEPVPRTAGAAARLAAKGRAILKRYQASKKD